MTYPRPTWELLSAISDLGTVATRLVEFIGNRDQIKVSPIEANIRKDARRPILLILTLILVLDKDNVSSALETVP